MLLIVCWTAAWLWSLLAVLQAYCDSVAVYNMQGHACSSLPSGNLLTSWGRNNVGCKHQSWQLAAAFLTRFPVP